MDDTKRKLIFSILNFLNDELTSPEHDSDSRESLEVVTQCLENVYSVSSTNPEDRKRLFCSKPLVDIFRDHLKANQKVASEDDKANAERLKNEGNELMKNQCFNEAIAKYTEAIDVDPNNAVYYSNRAAAHSKNGDHHQAISDCQTALSIDNNYSKAYGRMGLAYTEIKQYDKAVQSYTKALEFDPSNESYKNNLRIAQDLASKASAPPTGPTLGGIDMNQFASGQMGGLSNVLSNPEFMNMATKLMANPEVVNAMSSMMQQSAGGSGSNGDPPNMNAFLQMGQRIAEQIEREDPDQVARLRQQFGSGGPGSGAGGANFPDQSSNGNADGANDS